MTEVIGAAATSLVFDIGDAIVATGVISDRVSVVAFFIVAVAGAEVDAGDTVTATRPFARVSAAILIVTVGVVAGFISRRAFLHIRARDPIAATSECTTAGARIAIDLVAVIAGLACVYPAVAANFEVALLRATVACLYVTVIAFLKAGILRHQVGAPDMITTMRHGTGAGAGIIGDCIAIITGLEGVIALFEIGAQHRITTTRRSAVRQAGVAGVVITIITDLTILDDPVATGRRRTGVAVGRWVVVAVIATFTRTDHTIAATG